MVLVNRVRTRLKQLLENLGYIVTRPSFPEGTDIDLRALLADATGKRGDQFTVVQVGANDGEQYDPIGELVKLRGWRLVAVEPEPGAFARLVAHYAPYSNVHCVQCAIGSDDGQAILYTLRPA